MGRQLEKEADAVGYSATAKAAFDGRAYDLTCVGEYLCFDRGASVVVHPRPMEEPWAYGRLAGENRAGWFPLEFVQRDDEADSVLPEDSGSQLGGLDVLGTASDEESSSNVSSLVTASCQGGNCYSQRTLFKTLNGDWAHIRFCTRIGVSLRLTGTRM